MNSRTSEFLAKAEKWLRWCDVTLDELEEHGEAVRLDDVERTFIHLLSSVTTVHEALAAAARSAGLDQWSEDLDALRKSDPLLLYVWKARDSETHDALVKWAPTMRRMTLQIVDEEAALRTSGALYRDDLGEQSTMLRLARFVYETDTDAQLFERMRERFQPLEHQLRKAGVRLAFSDSLALNGFAARDKKGKKMHVQPARSHLGKPVEPSAHRVAFLGVKFYRDKHRELTALLDRHGA